MQTHVPTLSAEMREALGLLDCPPPPADLAVAAAVSAATDAAFPIRILKALPLNSDAFGGLEEGMFPGHHAQPVRDAIG